MSLSDSWACKLPNELTAWILSQWLSPREAAKLEAAFVQPAHRMAVLKYCFDDGFVHTVVQCKSYTSQFQFMQWLVKRSLLATAISIPCEAELGDSATGNFLYHCGHHLKRVDFIGNGSDNHDRTIRQIACNCKYLEEIKMTDWHRMKEGSIERILCANRKVHSIDFSRCKNLKDRSLHPVARYCPELRSLTLQGCTSITDEALIRIATGCLKIQHIDVSDTNLLGEGIMAVANHCRELRSLKMKYRWNSAELQALPNQALPQIDLLAIALLCRNLHTIDVSYLPTLIGPDIEAFVLETAGRLRELHINGVETVDDITMRAIGRCCPLLTHLSVSHCPLVSDTGVLAVLQGCKQLQTIALTGNNNVTVEVRTVLGGKVVM